MTVDNINVDTTLKQVKNLLATEEGLSPALRISLETQLLLVTILINRLGLNSNNSSKPPSNGPESNQNAKGFKRSKTWWPT